MLSEVDRLRNQELKSALEKMLLIASAATMGDTTMGDTTMGDATMGDATMGDATMGDATMGDVTIGDVTTLQPAFAQVQELFTVFMTSFQEVELDAAVAPRWQSLYTEIHKQIRLLGMDIMFLQASRQGNVAQQRQKQIVDRLKILIGYCDALSNN